MVSRTENNLTTMNTAYSYVGVHLPGKPLVLTAYTLRNGVSEKRTMLSWRLEGSNDMAEWHTLDMRRHKLTASVQEQLCKPGTVSTWGVDTELMKKHP